ncbi:phytoene/squalene synthase family protein [Sphingomonas sp.]|uniref:phytoene/squalene synthase family protein n=1 Tax=Sphingomonas sp. TaxID=28214 RepID=UPI0025F52A25|nr:phytoene/squalene synthase family protein [Sphingomonas sp.]
MTRAALVETARLSIARGSQSFAMASRLFDQPTREKAWLLYSWCRKCDDIADGQDHGGARSEVTDPATGIAKIRDLTALALAGQPTGDPAFDAIGQVARETAMPHAFIDDLITGFAMDSADWSPRTENDLLTYCYHVAGVVGCMMAVVMGVAPDDEATLDRACDLGLAFQLANIARDISEDDAVGRCYLPMDWLVEADIPPGEHMRPHYRGRLADMAWWLANMVGDYEASARVGAAKLPFRSRWAVLAAAGIYGDIARRVDALDQAAWDSRVVISKGRKLGWVLKAMGQAVQPAPSFGRDGLWTRPRLSQS